MCIPWSVPLVIRRAGTIACVLECPTVQDERQEVIEGRGRGVREERGRGEGGRDSRPPGHHLMEVCVGESITNS